MKFRHTYCVYILLCVDGSYYTGVTNSLDRRLEEHDQGFLESCYTFSRRPVVLKFAQHFEYVNDAINKEKQIKGWSRKKKEALINGDFDELVRLAKSRSRTDGA